MSQNPNEIPESGEVDQSEALKRAILKLKESGMLTHVPDELMEKAESKPSSSANSAPKSDDKAKDVFQEDVTHPAVAHPERPTIATTSDEVEHHADERANWAAVMAGWDDTPEKTSSQPEAKVEEIVLENKTKTQESQQLFTVDDKGKTQESQQVRTIQDDELGTTTEPKKETSSEEQAITLTRKEIKPAAENALTSPREQTPWILQQFFDGEIDLDQELSKRFPTVPMLSSIKLRNLGSKTGRKVATLTSQDGSAQLIIDADTDTKHVQLSFNYGSMMTLRYSLLNLSSADRERWLELMQREQGGMAFLWGASRWDEDYLICIARKLGTNIYAFSPKNFESAIRLSPTVMTELIQWLDEIWKAMPEPPEDDDSPLLTW